MLKSELSPEHAQQGEEEVQDLVPPVRRKLLQRLSRHPAKELHRNDGSGLRSPPRRLPSSHPGEPSNSETLSDAETQR